jgi:hypothetical protein
MLNEFDNFMDKLKMEYNQKGVVSETNKEYDLISYEKRKQKQKVLNISKKKTAKMEVFKFLE